MNAGGSGDQTSRDRQWFIVERWQQYAGESRANLLRIVAVGAFYGVELLNYYWLSAISLEFHQAVTGLAVAWSMLALGVLLCLQRQVFPPFLKYLSTGCDVLLLTAMAAIGVGPQSSLVFVYFLIVALSALRFSLPLVWFSTAASMLGYVTLLGLGHPDWFGSVERPLTVPRAEELIVLLSLAGVGIVMGQIIRRGREIADEYARRIGASAEDSAT